MYILCFGDVPLDNLIGPNTIDFNLFPKFEAVPTQAKNLMNKLLRIDPKERITAEQALKHRYFKLNLNQGPTLKREVSAATSRLAGLIGAAAQYEHNDIENYTDQDPIKKEDDEEEEEENNDNDN